MEGQKPIQIEYESPPPRPRRPLTSIRLTVLFGTIAGLLTLVALLIVPPMERLAKNAGMQLPQITQWFLEFGWWFKVQGWVYVWSAVIVVPILVTQVPKRTDHPVDQEKRRRWLATNIVMLVVALIVVVTAFAAIWPMVSLIQAASGP